MLSLSAHHKIYLAIQAVDFRAGIDGLAALCRQHFQLDPLSGHCFVFRNRRGGAIKLLVYDSQGFWLCHKRLSKSFFRYWPKSPTSLILFNATQLQVLLQNGDPSSLDMQPPWRSSS